MLFRVEPQDEEDLLKVIIKAGVPAEAIG